MNTLNKSTIEHCYDRTPLEHCVGIKIVALTYIECVSISKAHIFDSRPSNINDIVISYIHVDGNARNKPHTHLNNHDKNKLNR